MSPALAAAVARALHRDPDQRYADATEMEGALRDSLRGRAPAVPTGWAPAEDTAATRMLTGTGATSAMPRTSPGAAAPAARAARRAAHPRAPRDPTSAAGPQAEERRGLRCSSVCSSCSRWRPPASPATRRWRLQQQLVQLREDVSGNVEDAVGELRGLIEDNTAH